ncbi:MAG: asparagine synthase (glutamine-hydrolyzing) [Anaerolineae bacterium]|nr:asparagine synthase (glutamine-hydrolyzing) [Anaerolineae bacterium]
MCGILGEITFDGAHANREWVRRACGIMAHRGPDGNGFYDTEEIVLGHRRLAIIDVDGGSQPMSYANQRYWITFNGEIYNYRELKSELSGLGYEFSTASDTEVILAAFAAWGSDSVTRLNGIFAFAIWDTLKHILFLARDHLGVKPLLYQHDHTGLRFASELKALLLHPRIDHSISEEGLQDYLSLGYTLSPKTILKNVYKLPPGHYLLVCDEQITERSYWDLSAYVNNPFPNNHTVLNSAIERFDDALHTAVHQQMISDVPLGAFLSGGIDSSSIVFYATQHASSFKTFSIGFEEESFSELDYADRVARHLRTDHHSMIVRPISLDDLSKLVWLYDEPLGDTSMIPTYFVSKMAREHVTVVLSGDGGDEALAGYDTYVADRLQSIYTKMPRWLHNRFVLPFISDLPSDYRKVSLNFKLKQFVDKAYTDPRAAHFGWRTMFDRSAIQALTHISCAAGDFSTFDRYHQFYSEVENADLLSQAQYVDIKTWLSDDILTKVDRASMACSVEARVPFLDHALVEFCLQLPSQHRLHGWQGKYILKRTMRDRLPRAITHRQKRGFNSPISLWMRGLLQQDIAALLDDGSSSIVDLRSPIIKNLWKEHAQGYIDHGFKLWTLLALLLWEKNNHHAHRLIDNSDLPGQWPGRGQ